MVQEYINLLRYSALPRNIGVAKEGTGALALLILLKPTKKFRHFQVLCPQNIDL